MRQLVELVGLALVVAFFAVWWWPSALLVAGIGLIVVANLPAAPAGQDQVPGEDGAP